MQRNFFYSKELLSSGFSVSFFKKAFLVMVIISLSLFSCAPKEVRRRTEPSPYQGIVTIDALKQSVGFGNVRSIKALADVTIFKQGKSQGSMNGSFGYKAPGKMRIDLFGTFGLTVTEILVSDDLLQLSVPQKNILYEWNAPELSFAGLMDGRFRYEMAEEADMYVLNAYPKDQQGPHITAKYYFDRTYLLNRTILFYKNGTEIIKTEFKDFNGRLPERIIITLSERVLINIALEEPELDSDISDEYFKTIRHEGKQIKSFQEIFKRFEPGP